MKRIVVMTVGLLMLVAPANAAVQVVAGAEATTPGTIELRRGFGVTTVSSAFSEDGQWINHTYRVRDTRDDGVRVCVRLRVWYGEGDPTITVKTCDRIGAGGKVRALNVPRYDPNSGNYATRTTVKLFAKGYGAERGSLIHPAPTVT